MKESELQKQILDYLDLKWIFHYRQNSGAFKRDDHFYRMGVSGAPDIICVIYGRYVGLELKTKTGRQNPNQQTFQKNLEAAGGLYFLIRNFEEGVDIIEDTLARLRRNPKLKPGA